MSSDVNPYVLMLIITTRQPLSRNRILMLGDLSKRLFQTES